MSEVFADESPIFSRDVYGNEDSGAGDVERGAYTAAAAVLSQASLEGRPPLRRFILVKSTRE